MFPSGESRGVGLGGMDGLFKAVRLRDPDGTDYGYVGEITEVNENWCWICWRGFIPVVSSVAAGVDEETNYNINADTAKPRSWRWL